MRTKDTELGKPVIKGGTLPELDTPPAVVTNHLPALATDNRGFEDMTDQDDLIIPRAVLLQAMSPILRDPEVGLKAGQIINNLTREVLKPTFTPIFCYKEYLRFNPRDKKSAGFDSTHEPGALIWRTRDANDPRVVKECAFGPNGEPPLALTALNFFSLFEGQSMPVILTFSKSSYKAGKNLLSLAKFRGGAMFSRRYKLTVREEFKDGTSYFTLKVDPAGDCSPDQFKVAETYFNQFASKREVIQASVDGAAE